jgi:ribonucleoside-diphosphate reductase alpha chain
MVEWTTRTSKISNLDGSTVFEMKDAQVPAAWSQLATDIMVSKYFRKAGVPELDPRTGKPVTDASGKVVTGPEKSAQQVIHRLAGCWRAWGEKHGYFDAPGDAQAFYDEVAYMMLTQMAAPNSPQWFNTGLNFAYGITGPAQGHWVVDPKTGEAKLADDAYTHPQPHACFIQGIDDDLVNEGGIMDLWVREARLFKYGSGTGTNFSKLRGENEKLSGGGRSSGLMSFLKIGDRAAGAIKSGGTTRRAAKMVCLDLDHPDIEQFVNWKVREEVKVAALVEGMKHLSEEQKKTAQTLGLTLDYDFNGEAYMTVSGQNSNNSVRISDAFFHALEQDADWTLVRRTDGKAAKTMKARALWDQIGYAAWRCADPGVQYDSTINAWHTCPNSGRINASNPCSEYMFLDNTACNLASLNLLKFWGAKERRFDVEGFEHATRLWTIVLEISVLMAAFPSREIARLSYDYRTLGLGFANIGAMLMQAGIAYDSEVARAICGCLTAIMTGRSYATSAEMAGQLGPFKGYYANREAMLRVIRNHRRAAHGVPRKHEEASKHPLGDYEGLEIKPVPIDAERILDRHDELGAIDNAGDLLQCAKLAWDDALEQGKAHGYRNAQTTVIAPTGTIGLLMDCDTTGVEPDFALVKFKKLAGGGYFKIANQSLRPALENLGYNDQQVRDILTHVMGALQLDVPMPAPAPGSTPGSAPAPGSAPGCADGSLQQDADDAGQPRTFAQFLSQKGFTKDDLRQVTDALPTVFELNFAFSPWSLPSDLLTRLGLAQKAKKPGFNLLRALGLTKPQITALNARICGTQTVEGAPHLKDAHLPVFDCANTCGPTGRRFIAVEGHIRMMAASQPFITGAISKTINLPNNASVEDIKSAYRLSWELGLKANALYRDGCKLSQPLNTKASDEDDGVQDQEDIEAGKEEVAAQVAGAAAHAAAAATEPAAPQIVEKIVERIVHRPMRRRLPDTRRSITHKFNIAGHEGYLTVGLYEDGQPGELFITMAKEGSTIGGLMDSLGTAISVALQYGVPVESLVNKFTHQRFEPAGMTHNPDIPFAKSLVDYIFRWMGMEFVQGYRAANAPRRAPKNADAAAPPAAPASTAAKDKADQVARLDTGREIAVPVEDAAKRHVLKAHERTAAMERLTDEPRRPLTAAPGNGHGNGNGHSHGGENTGDTGGDTAANTAVAVKSALEISMREMQADAPACDVCGTITVRSGTCYKCMNCGNSMGCS